MELYLEQPYYNHYKQDSLLDVIVKEKNFNTINYKELLNEFVRTLDATDKTKKDYYIGTEQFIKWCLDNNISEVKREDLVAYKTDLKAKYKPTTVNSLITSLKAFYRFLATKGIKNLASDLKSCKQDRGFKKDALTIEQCKDLLVSIDRTTTEGIRNYALIKLFLATGLREIEVYRANIEDIRQIGNTSVLYVQGKGRTDKDEFVILNYKTLKAIQDYLATKPKVQPSEPLFTSVSNKTSGNRLSTRGIREIVKTALRKIGINSNRITCHSLRHTAITLCLKGGATIQEAQALARHSNISTTMIYSHNIDRIESNPEEKIERLLDI